MNADFLKELEWRNLLHQVTADEPLKSHIALPGRVAYCGFDPTADSLTIGNFIAIKLLMHWQQAGHKPIVLMGGGTGLIGDPSGRDSERQFMSQETIEKNIAGQRKIFEKLLDFDPRNPNAAVIVNNADWLSKLGYLEMLRDVGKHFSVNAMIQKDSVRERLQNREQGISYTEFSYMLLQAYDFKYLHNKMNCSVQIAGSDQYGNIVAGLDLIRRGKSDGNKSENNAFGITSPLVTKSDGRKFGKNETGAIWLSADKTSPYKFYQFWMNTGDADVVPYLKWFTFMDREEIAELADKHEHAPHKREAHRALAWHMTELLHGRDGVKKVEAVSQVLFSGDITSIDGEMLDDIFTGVPHTELRKSKLEGKDLRLIELLTETGLAKGLREARQLISSGAVTMNGVRQYDTKRLLGEDDLLHGDTIVLKRGKRIWHVCKWKSS